MPRWRTRTATALAVPLLLLTACGSQEAPAKLEPITPAVPDDLCSLLPQDAVGGLQTASSSDPTGTPTAACSLSSAPGATPAVRAVVTTTRYDDQATASGVFDSQCRALDATSAQVQKSLQIEGADKGCGSQQNGADVSTLAAQHGSYVLTARVSSTPAGNPSALARGTQLLQAVLSGASTAPSSPASSPSS